jgi:hypothetical protein
MLKSGSGVKGGMKKNPGIQMQNSQQPEPETAGQRDLWQHVKVTPAERASWKAAAAAEGLTVADLIRKRMGTVPEGRAPKRIRAARRADPRLLQAAGRIGSNLNQIARWCNTHAEGASAVQVLAALLAIDQALTSFSYRPDPAGHAGTGRQDGQEPGHDE